MVELLSILIGFLIGLVAAGIAVELGLKKLLAPPENSKLTTVWSLDELPDALVVTSGFDGVAIPRSARIVSKGPLPTGNAQAQCRSNKEAKGNFAVSGDGKRGLIFLDGVRKGALALWTVDEQLITRLRAEFNRLWTRSTDYVEPVRVADVLKHPNSTVKMRGRVEQVLPFKDGYIMRLSEEGETIGVVMDREPGEITGRQVTVTGIVKPSGSSGFALVEALEVAA